MKGYRFRLESVLRVRRLQEEQRRAAFAAARIEVQAAEAARTAKEQRYRAALGGGAQPRGPWLAEQERRERLAQAVLAARAAEIRLGELMGERRAEWEAAAADLAALERLDERHREEFVAEALAAEQRDLDELATSRFGYAERRRREEERLMEGEADA